MWTTQKELERIKEYREKIKATKDKKTKIQLLTYIDSILNGEVKAEVHDIVRNLATMWKADPSSLAVSHSTSLDHEENDKNDAYNYHANFWGNQGFNDKFAINLVISNPNQASTQTATIISFVHDTDIQKDAHKLVDHMRFDVEDQGDSTYTVSAQFKDLQNTILTFRLSELVNDDIQPLDTTSKAVLNAVDDRIKRNESIML